MILKVCCAWMYIYNGGTALNYITAESNSDEFYSSISGTEESGSEDESTSGTVVYVQPFC